MSTYALRKRRLLAGLRMVWLVVTLTLLALLCAVAIVWIPSDWLKMSLVLLGRDRKGLDEAGLRLQDFAPLMGLLSLGLSGVVVAYRVRHRVARFAFERFFDGFNDGVLSPIRRPVPQVSGDSPMAWIAPEQMTNAARRDVWHGLKHWAALQECSFAWTLLIGRSGVGKSRLADELARELGRRELLGDAPAAHSGRSPGSRWRLRVGATWRRAFGRVGTQDPWDTGRPAYRSVDGAELLQLASDYEGRLASWQPRAPTLIVFEDPRTGECAALIRMISTRLGSADEGEADEPYRFPVRLLVVNQTIPSDLQLHPKRGGGWTSDLPHFSSGPWMLNEESYFTPAEWRAIARNRFGSEDHRPWGIDSREFIRLTRNGHPLLTELLLAWLVERPGHGTADASRLTTDSLLADRANRIIVSLQGSGLRSHDGWIQLAAAALVGGLPRERDDLHLPASALQRAFPNEDIQRRIPAIRPDLIGQAFACAVIEATREDDVAHPASDVVQAETAQRIAKSAWQGDPLGSLLALDRMHGSESFPQPHESDARRLLLRAMVVASETSSGTDATALTRAYARYSLIQGRIHASLPASLARTDPQTALVVATTDIFDTAAVVFVSRVDALRIFSMASERAMDGDASDAAPRLLQAWQRIVEELAQKELSTSHETNISSTVLMKLVTGLGTAAASTPGSQWANEAFVHSVFASLGPPPFGLMNELGTFARCCACLAPEGPTAALCRSGRLYAAALDASRDANVSTLVEQANVEVDPADVLGAVRVVAARRLMAYRLAASGRVEDAMLWAESAEGTARAMAADLAECRQLAMMWCAQAWAFAAPQCADDRCALGARRCGDARSEVEAWRQAAVYQGGRELPDVAAVERVASEADRAARAMECASPAMRSRVLAVAAGAWQVAATQYAQANALSSGGIERCRSAVHSLAQLIVGRPPHERWEIALETLGIDISLLRANMFQPAVLDEATAIRLIEALRADFPSLPASEADRRAHRFVAVWSALAERAGDGGDGLSAERYASVISGIHRTMNAPDSRLGCWVAHDALSAWTFAAVAFSHQQDGANAERCAGTGDRMYPIEHSDASTGRRMLSSSVRSIGWQFAANAYRAKGDMEGAARAEARAEEWRSAMEAARSLGSVAGWGPLE